MKNQLFIGLFMSLFALTLSACVGAVNIDAGKIAEAKTEKTDEPTPEVKTFIITEPEPQEVVEIPNSCLTNPFGDTCMENFATERETITMKCIADVTGDLCHQAITQVCLNTFSSRLCNKIPTYLDEFKACGYELDSESCTPTITRACRDFENNFGSNFGDVFNLLCEEAVEPETKELVKSKPTPPNPCIANPFQNICKADFNTARELVCYSERKSNRCYRTIVRVCEANILNTLCEGTTSTYNFRRELACREEPDSARCAPTVARVCDAYAFHTFCNGNPTYYPAREKACENPSNSYLCAPTIARACGLNPFNTLCVDNETYYPAQETACASEPDSERCDRPIRRVCKTTPFNALCQSKNLNLNDLPIDIKTIEGSSPSAICGYHVSGYPGTYTSRWGCYAHYPTDIDIKPLNNNNTGIAIYAGSVSLTNIDRIGNSGRTDRTENIDITVNFNNNTITRSYDVETSFFNFIVNGNFTNRGHITGSVSYLNYPSNLTGLIGQTEMIGVFSNSESNLLGGFTATREE